MEIKNKFLQEDGWSRFNKIIVGFVIWMIAFFIVIGVSIIAKNIKKVEVPEVTFNLLAFSQSLFGILLIVHFVLISVIISYCIGHWALNKWGTFLEL